jgi:hypothetical protein
VFRRTVNIFNIRTRKRDMCIRSGSNPEVAGASFNRNCNRTYLNDDNFRLSMEKRIGQTITIFTTSGGDSGSGFTGVLLGVGRDHIRILSRLASGPGTYGDISLGAVTNIPVDKIAAFVHNAI